MLMKAAATVRDSVREIDVAARYGGEEFAVLLPDTSRLGAFVVAERIRRRIEERFARARTPVTISGGIAVFPDDAGTPADLIVQADAGLYGAKAAGKNRILLPQGERRRFRRLPAPQRVTLATEATRAPADVKNLSEGGLLVSLREAVAMGSAVSLTIERPDAAPVGAARRGGARRARAGGDRARLRRRRARSSTRPRPKRSSPRRTAEAPASASPAPSREKIGGWVSSYALLLERRPAAAGPPLPEGNAFVRGLVGEQRQREEALSLYTYDVTEVREQLDGDGRARRRETRGFEVFHVKGRPVRRLVAKDGRPLAGKEREKEERRARAISRARCGPGGRRASSRACDSRASWSATSFSGDRAGRRWTSRCALVFDFAARPGDFDLERDGLLRRLAGRLWVDEAGEGRRARSRSATRQACASPLGLGATVSSLSFHGRVPAAGGGGVAAPLAMTASAEGQEAARSGASASAPRPPTTDYRRFEVDVLEEMRWSSRGRFLVRRPRISGIWSVPALGRPEASRPLAR